MKQLTAYCGLDCEVCEARLATIRGDEALRQKVAAVWSELNGAHITPDMIRCEGCRTDGMKTPYCESLCPIRQCASGRKLETCGSCEEKESCAKLGAVVRNNPSAAWNLRGYTLHTLRDRPDLLKNAAAWFHEKWGVPEDAYLDCMTAYLNRETEYGWYLCLDGSRIIGGMGVIENDFHDRKDLAPNICAVYTEADFRGQGIAGRLLDMTVKDMKEKGISPLYLVTDTTGFYERYGWEFLCTARSDGETELSRVYIHH